MNESSNRSNSVYSTTLTELTLLDKPRKQQSFIEQVAQLSPSIIAVFNVNTGNYIYVNSAIESILGYSSDDWTTGGISFISSLVHPDDYKTVMAENQKALELVNSTPPGEHEPVFNFEYRIRHKNGNWIWFHTFGTVFNRDAEGNVEHALNISLDITARKEMEQSIKQKEEELRKLNKQLEMKILERTKELQESEQKLREAQHIAHMGNWEYNLKTGTIYWSEEIFRIHGLDQSQGEPSYPEFIKLFTDPPLLEQSVANAISKGIPYELDLEIKRPDGEIRYIQAMGRPIFNDAGKCIKLYGATIDITDRKELEKRKDDFINMASHELKTPLTSMNIFIDVLSKHIPEDNKKAKHYTQRIKDQVVKLKELGDNMLDVSRIRTGKLVLASEKFRLDTELKKVVEDVQVESTKHKIKILETESITIRADRERIVQVLTNLLTNAVKYSPDSEDVLVRLKRTDTEVTVSVQDFGIGIPAEQIDRIFEKLYQVPELRDKSYPGLGLGLYISKEIITSHHGKIWVESKKGTGSTFFVTLPIAS